MGVPEGAAPVPPVEPSRASPRVAPSDGGGAFLFNASPRVAPEGAPVRTQASQPQGASPRVAPAGGGEILFNASPSVAPGWDSCSVSGITRLATHRADRRAGS